MDKLGNYIRKARLEKQLSQEELATLLYLTKNQIGHYENNRSVPSAEMIYNIAKALDKPIGYFYGEEPNIKEQETINKIDLVISSLNSLKEQLSKGTTAKVNEDSNRTRVAKKEYRKVD